MGTSRSSKRGGRNPDTSSPKSAPWRVTAMLYSGRPDPEWTIPESLAQRALLLFNQLPPAAPAHAPPPLGYRGITLTCADGRRWTAANKRVTSALSGQSAPEFQTRLDAAGAFEDLLLSSAPAGVLPLRPGELPS